VIAMDPTYKALAEFAQTWGLLFFFIVFLAIAAYAFWPSNKKKFDDAARSPLREDD
jgi:cytochrome c oxidase cbb3-type subunit 4